MIFGGGLPGTKRRNIEGRAGVRARDANVGRRGRVDGFAIAETTDRSAPTTAKAKGEPKKNPTALYFCFG